eukprot:SAG11_NODE_4402_length_1910_cov_2.511872_2_plen_134_part_00
MRPAQIPVHIKIVYTQPAQRAQCTTCGTDSSAREASERTRRNSNLCRTCSRKYNTTDREQAGAGDRRQYMGQNVQKGGKEYGSRRYHRYKYRVRSTTRKYYRYKYGDRSTTSTGQYPKKYDGEYGGGFGSKRA